jgi:hypothetical protein
MSLFGNYYKNKKNKLSALHDEKDCDSDDEKDVEYLKTSESSNKRRVKQVQSTLHSHKLPPLDDADSESDDNDEVVFIKKSNSSNQRPQAKQVQSHLQQLELRLPGVSRRNVTKN